MALASFVILSGAHEGKFKKQIPQHEEQLVQAKTKRFDSIQKDLAEVDKLLSFDSAPDEISCMIGGTEAKDKLSEMRSKNQDSMITPALDDIYNSLSTEEMEKKCSYSDENPFIEERLKIRAVYLWLLKMKEYLHEKIPHEQKTKGRLEV